ncbi:DNA 3'-5' helicase OS=Streptomyces alboniger OX=132473 GN=CP975_23565 PE=3 SV=1 [Streptomyces alboniger]
MEAPFQITIAGRVVRGRIDAVYRDGDDEHATYEIVDWKTASDHGGDPLQLALYRLAWAERRGLPRSRSRRPSCTCAAARSYGPTACRAEAALERLLREESPEAVQGEPPGDEPHDRAVGAGR